MEPNTAYGAIQYSNDATENIYELAQVEPEVKKDTKSLNSLSENVKTKVVVPEKMKFDSISLSL